MYETKQEQIAVIGVADLTIRSLLNRQQFFDPLGEADQLGISSAMWPVFGLLWPSGAHLAARLAARPVSGEQILEIGCGLALASLVGHRRGALVTASDCHPLTARFLLDNLRLNGLPPMPYRHGHWGAASEIRQANNPVQGRYNLIMGSDVLYERDASGALAAFIALHASPGAEVWIIDPNRGNRPAFHRQMAGHGFVLHEERLDTPAALGVLAYKGRLLVYSLPKSVESASRQ